MSESKVKIKITKNGPYLVSGHVKLREQIITPKGRGYEWKEGRPLPQGEQYALCRCGHSKNAPFCDGSHLHVNFDGTETASKADYTRRAELQEGPGIDLLDDHRCAFARFCHRSGGDVWQLTDASDTPMYKDEAIRAASECPSGRLVAVQKDGEMIEPDLEPSIDIIQDPQEGVSGGIFVKGYIPIESADGETYEVRNRVVLCRCGKSQNKPFCNGAHVNIKFKDR